MLTIGSCWLSYEENPIYVLKPMAAESPGAHYVLIFLHRSGVQFLCCSGQREFDALISCVTKAAASMTKKASKARPANDGGSAAQRISVESVSVEIRTRLHSAGHEVHDVTLQLGEVPADPDEPCLEPCEFAGSYIELEMSATELAAFARAFKRIAKAKYAPAFMARIDEWFLPPALFSCDSEAEIGDEFLTRAVEHIEAECPEAAEFWVEILGQLSTLNEDWTPPELSYMDCENEESYATTAGRSNETQEFVPWLERLALPEAGDYEDETGMFYTIGKDQAFQWMGQNPDTTREALVEELIKDQRLLPPKLARETAEKIAARVFYVRELEGHRS
jgi:hypothetical protein